MKIRVMNFLGKCIHYEEWYPDDYENFDYVVKSALYTFILPSCILIDKGDGFISVDKLPEYKTLLIQYWNDFSNSLDYACKHCY